MSNSSLYLCRTIAHYIMISEIKIIRKVQITPFNRKYYHVIVLSSKANVRIILIILDLIKGLNPVVSNYNFVVFN